MSDAVINVLTVPAGRGETLGQRFADRAAAVETSVCTRWRSKADFEAWTSSQSFGQGHAGTGGAHDGDAQGAGGEAPRPAATGSSIWAFEVVQSVDPADAGR